MTAALAVLVPATARAHGNDDPPRHPHVDLALSLAGAPALAQAGEPVTFTMTVTNQSNPRAKRLHAAVALTGGVRILSATGTGWSCTLLGSLADCRRAWLRRGASTELVVAAVAPAGFSRLGAGAVVASRGDDKDEGDNTAAAEIAVNNAPVIGPDSATTTQDTPVEIQVLDDRDFDPDGDPIDIVSVTPGAFGTVACHDFLFCVYTPAAGRHGTDTFTYTVSDGRGGSATATVTVTVTPVPPPPPPPPGGDAGGGNSDTGVVVSGPGAVTPGPGIVDYTLVVSNGCVVVARQVRVRVILPAGTTLVGLSRGATRAGRIVTMSLGSVSRSRPRGIRLRLRFGPRGGDLRPLVVSVASANAKLTGDGIVIAVRSRAG